MNRKNVIFLATAFALGLGIHNAPAQVFHQGNLVVTTYGDPSATLADGAPTPLYLREYTTSGTYVSTLTLPLADGVGGTKNYGIDGEYGSSSEGNIQPTGDGRYLTIGGYSATAAAKGIQPATDAANGDSFPTGTAYSSSTIALAQSVDTDVPRVAALIDVDGNVNSSSIFNDIFSTNNSRSVYSSNASTLYFSGQGTGTTDQGIWYAPVGINTVTTSSTPTGIYNSVDTRFVTAYGGNLYFSVDKKNVETGIYEFTGFPTAGATPTLITAAGNGSVHYSPEGFFFASPTVLYVADTGAPKNKSGATGDGGIQKWVYSGGSWSLAYTFANPSNFVSRSSSPGASSGETGFAAITGQVSGNTVQLFATSYTAGDDNPDGLYAVTDTLTATSNSAVPTEIASAPGNGGYVFKGVAFALTTLPPPADTPAMPPSLLLLLCALLAAAGVWLFPKPRTV